MDPLTIIMVGAIAFIAIAISLAAFKMFAKETNFEEAYGASALRLLAEEKGSKSKAGKSNKNKSKTADRKKEKDSGSDKDAKNEKKHEEPMMAPTPEPIVVHEEPKPVEVNTELKHKRRNKNKQVQEEMKHTEAEAEPANVQKTATPTEDVPAVPEVAPVMEHVNTEVATTKGKKKRARRASENQKEQAVKEEAPIVHTEAKPLEAAAATKSSPKEHKAEKHKAKKATISVKDINPDRLHTRLSAIEELEPEYLSFLATYFSDSGAQKIALNKEISSLGKLVTDKELVITQCAEKLTAALRKDAEIAQLQHSVSEEKKKYALFEQSVCSQLTSGAQEKKFLQRVQDQLKAEVASLNEELKKAQAAVHAAPPPVDTTAFEQQIDVLKAELSNSKTRSSQLESELSQRMQVLQELQKEAQNRDRQLEQLNQTIAANEQHAKDVEQKGRMDVQNLEAKLQSTQKMMEELQTVATKVREDAVQKAASDKTNLEKETSMLKELLAKVEAERDEARKDAINFHKKFDDMGAEHKKALSQLSAEISSLHKLNEENKAKISAQMSKDAEELMAARRALREIKEEKEATDALVVSTIKELEVCKKDSEQMQTKVKELRAQLDEAERNAASNLKCAHCAARILDKQPPSVCGVEFRPRDEVLSPVRRDVHSLTRSAATSPINSFLDAGDAYIEPPHTPPRGSSPFTAEVRVTPPAVQKFGSSNAISESDAEEEDLEWRANHVHPQAIVCFDLIWVVPDWDASDAPKEVLVSGSFWGWQPARAMSRTKVGFCLQVELPLTCEDGVSPVQYAKSDSGRGSPLAGHQTAHEFKFVVDGVWRCADHYMKKVSKDGSYTNNVVYY